MLQPGVIHHPEFTCLQVGLITKQSVECEEKSILVSPRLVFASRLGQVVVWQ